MAVPTDVRVALLGPLQVEVGDGALSVPVGQQRRVLVALAIAAGTVVSTDRLVATLWGEDSPPSAVNSLQSHIARLRRTLDVPDVVVRRGNGYMLALGPEAVDAPTFEQLVETAAGSDDLGERRALLDRALGSWRGTEPAAVVEAGLVEDAVRLGQRRLAALTARAGSALAVGDTRSAEDDLRAVLVTDPLREPAVALLLRVLATDGRVAEADATFQRVREDLAEAHGLDPSPQLEAVHRKLLRGELPVVTTEAAMDPSGPPRVTPVVSLPRFSRPARPRSSFHGRDELLRHVTSLVGTEPCTTLVGPGGVGKTRLALEVAHLLGEEVVWADLVDARNVGDVLGRLAVAVGCGTPKGLDDLGPLAAGILGRVVVLDNCEQVADAVASILAALAAHPEVRVLATSRTPLHVDGECVARLPLLATADGNAPAVRVFLDRAGDAVDTTDAGQLEVAREVVTCLDGLPLALELAARQARNLGLRAVRDRLHDRLELLQAGRLPGHPAHGDLRELVRWSTDQLSDTDARVLRLLGMFAGPFTLEQVEDLLAAAGVPRPRVAGVLARLVEHSLVVGAADDRFRLLETVRACMLEDLEAAGEQAVGHAAHTAAVLAASGAAATRYATADEPAGLDELHALVPDVQSLTGRLITQLDVTHLTRLVSTLHVYAYHTQRNELLAAAGVVADLLETGAGADLPDDLASAAWSVAALEAAVRGASDRALELAARATDGRAADTAVARAWEVRGDVLLSRGDPGAAGAYEGMLAAAGELGRTDLEVSGWVGLALVRAYTGDHAGSRVAAGEAEVRAAVLGVPSLVAWAAYARGEAEAAHDPDAALEAFATAVRVARPVDNHLAVWAASNGAAVVRARHGEPAPALAELRTTIEGWSRAGNAAVQRTVLRNLGVLLARVGHDEPAAVLLGAGGSDWLYEEERRRVQQARRAIIERLGAPTVERLQQQGGRMDEPALIDFALAATDHAVGA